jgi:hypothetical protein
MAIKRFSSEQDDADIESHIVPSGGPPRPDLRRLKVDDPQDVDDNKDQEPEGSD